jgi:hypothetical protein
MGLSLDSTGRWRGLLAGRRMERAGRCVVRPARPCAWRGGLAAGAWPALPRCGHYVVKVTKVQTASTAELEEEIGPADRKRRAGHRLHEPAGGHNRLYARRRLRAADRMAETRMRWYGAIAKVARRDEARMADVSTRKRRTVAMDRMPKLRLSPGLVEAQRLVVLNLRYAGAEGQTRRRVGGFGGGCKGSQKADRSDGKQCSFHFESLLVLGSCDRLFTAMRPLASC